jgi:hypothetical protein
MLNSQIKLIYLDDINQKDFKEVDELTFNNFMKTQENAKKFALYCNDPADCYILNNEVISYTFEEYSTIYFIPK